MIDLYPEDIKRFILRNVPKAHAHEVYNDIIFIPLDVVKEVWLTLDGQSVSLKFCNGTVIETYNKDNLILVSDKETMRGKPVYLMDVLIMDGELTINLHPKVLNP
mgnify:CR=1 FL=1